LIWWIYRYSMLLDCIESICTTSGFLHGSEICPERNYDESQLECEYETKVHNSAGIFFFFF
jgi:hypothetical protein